MNTKKIKTATFYKRANNSDLNISKNRAKFGIKHSSHTSTLHGKINKIIWIGFYSYFPRQERLIQSTNQILIEH